MASVIKCKESTCKKNTINKSGYCVIHNYLITLKDKEKKKNKDIEEKIISMAKEFTCKDLIDKIIWKKTKDDATNNSIEYKKMEEKLGTEMAVSILHNLFNNKEGKLYLRLKDVHDGVKKYLETNL